MTQAIKSHLWDKSVCHGCMHGKTIAMLEKTNFVGSCTSLMPALSALPELHLTALQVPTQRHRAVTLL